MKKYNGKTLNERGTGMMAAMLAVVLLVLIGAGYYVWHSRQHNAAPSTSSQSTNTNTAAVTPDPTANNSDIVVNDCPGAPNTSMCKFFYSKYQLGVSYPAGWRASTETIDTGSPLYSLDLSPQSEQMLYIRLNVYKGTLESVSNEIKTGLEAKDTTTVTSVNTTVQGKKALRLDYTKGTGFAENAKQSEYLIESHGFVFDFNSLLRADTPKLSVQTSKAIFDSLKIWQ